jgi:hypothetical protein
MTTATSSLQIIKKSGGFYSWPLLAIRGMAALVYALVALADFKATIPLLVWFFAIYVLFDGAYALRVAVGQQIDGLWTRLAVIFKGLLGIAAGIIVIYWDLSAGSTLYILLTVFVWVALSGILEGVWVIRNIKNKELVLIIGSGAYLALAVALQFLFALAPQAGLSIYSWIIIGFSAAFGLGMLIMSWAMRKNQFG